MTFRKTIIRAVALVALLTTISPASATEVRGSFNAVVTIGEEVRAGEAVSSFPILGVVALQVGQLGLSGFDSARIVFQGWFKQQLGDDELHDNIGDIGLLYFDASTGILSFRVGRQHVLRGVGRMAMIDGADIRVDIIPELSAEAFVGTVVHREFDTQSGDWHAGGRLGTHFAGANEIGVSYAHRRNDGDVDREELALDWYSLIGPVRLLGFAAMSPSEVRLAEARLAATIEAIDNVSLTVDFDRVYPDLKIPRDSIFSVFSESAHDSFGLNARWEPCVYWSVDVDGDVLLQDGDLGYKAGLRVRTYRDPNHRSFVGAGLRRLDVADSGYIRGRVLTGLQLLEELRVAADVYAYLLDEDINDVGTSFLGQLSLVYDFGSAFRLAGTVTGGSTPYASAQIEGMLRFGYGLNVDFGREVAP